MKKFIFAVMFAIASISSIASIDSNYAIAKDNN